MISTATVVGFSAVFLATTAGAALVFFVSDGASEKRYAAFSGFAAGIMAAASVFSLLLPAIDGFLYFGSLKFIPATLSFLLGGAFFSVTDGIVKRLTRRRVGDDGYVRPLRTFAAMTIHNVPEGLAVGVLFFGGEMVDNRRRVSRRNAAYGGDRLFVGFRERAQRPERREQPFCLDRVGDRPDQDLLVSHIPFSSFPSCRNSHQQNMQKRTVPTEEGRSDSEKYGQNQEKKGISGRQKRFTVL